MGMIDRIEVENFKSYKDHQIIGPFKKFTAIIGPNGSGKSNVMDAISFVLGVSSRHLRGSVLKDLIYKVEGEKVTRRSAYVKMIYTVSGDKVDDLFDGQELSFMRLISPSGVSSYRIDDSEVTWEAYSTMLSSLKINIKARNCLIFQGDVESIASKNPRECTKFFEYISNSGEIEEEYDRLKTEMEAANNDAIFHFQKKKSVGAEKKELKEQKEEAESFTVKQEELAILKLEYFLFRLFRIDQELEGEIASQDADDATKQKLEAADRVLKRQMEEKKAAIGTKSLDAKRAEREVTKLKSTLKDTDVKIIKMKDEKDFLLNHIKSVQQEKDRLQESYDTAVEKREALRVEIQSDMEGLQRAADDMASSVAANIQLDGGQLDEYEKIRGEVGSKTATNRVKLQTLLREQKQVDEELHRTDASFRDLKEQLDLLVDNQHRLSERKVKVSERIGEDEKKIEAFKVTMSKVQGEIDGAMEDFNRIEADLEEVVTKLSSARQDSRESASQKNMQIALDAMKRLYPGVLGRLFNLCNPSQQKYRMAISTALGMWMDAIVVETEETAKLCMKYLRDQRVGTAHFLPLNSIRPKDINERYRDLGPKYRLAIDVLTFDEALDPAFRYACGNAVIANTLEDARQLAFRGNEKVKVVTLDGSVISKSGTMTGGLTADDQRRAERWEDADVERLRSKKRELEGEKEYLRKEFGVASGRQSIRGAKADELERLQTEVKSLQNRIIYSAEDIKLADAKLEKGAADMVNIEKEIAVIKPTLQKLQAQRSAKESTIANMEKEMHKLEDRMFASFCEKVGISDIREYESSKLAKSQELLNRKRELNEHKSKLEAALAYENSRDLKEPLKQAAAKLESVQTKLSKFEKQLSKTTKESASLKVTLEEKDREFKKLSDIVKEGELEHKVITDECNKVKTTLTQLLRVMNSREMSIAKLRAFRKDTLQQAAVDKVSMPFVSGADSYDEDENRMDIETPNQTQGDSSAPSGDTVRVRTGEIDYKKLSRDLKSQQSNAQHESQVKRMQGLMADLGAQLSRMQPNMKAVDQYEDVENRFKATQTTLDAARSKAKESEADFEKVKERRSHLFNKAFNHIKKKISNVYKDLTKSKKHTAGGEAYLDVDDPEEPYNGGIRFHTIPPGKQFRDMEQLSGGEKTVAALALLFSIHSYQPSPFFIMDEVDAALDNTNVSKVSNYIRRRSDDFQCIVISLKDQFYGKADSVIGIYRDRNENCSRTLSLDLEPYAL